MRKATATYVAPPGDSKVCEMGGVTFFDGKPVELDSYEHPGLIDKLQNNQFFDIKVGEDDKQSKPAVKKRGRPSHADVAAAKAAAVEADRLAKEAADKAKLAKAEADDFVKAAGTKDPAVAGQGSPIRNPFSSPPTSPADQQAAQLAHQTEAPKPAV